MASRGCLLLLVLGAHVCLASSMMASALSRWQHKFQEAELPSWASQEIGASLAKRREQAQPLSVDDILRVAGVKRNTFWRPLAFLPASARLPGMQSAPSSSMQSSEVDPPSNTLHRYG